MYDTDVQIHVLLLISDAVTNYYTWNACRVWKIQRIAITHPKYSRQISKVVTMPK